MSYKFHKSGYKKEIEPRPSKNTEGPSSYVAKSISHDNPREGTALNSPYYPSNGLDPSLGARSNIPNTATRSSDLSIRNDSTPALSLGGLGLI